jgi:hypothetical protein
MALHSRRIELCWPLVMKPCFPQPAKRKHKSVSKIPLVKTDVFAFAFHIALIL